MIFELLYTSAPKGLKPGSKGYCTVLVTEGAPSALQERLEGFSGYRHLFDPGSSSNPVTYAHRIIAVSGSKWHVLSRVADYGADYSQRSNLIAHHVAISSDEIGQFPFGPATLMLSPTLFRTQWQGEPRRINEAETRGRVSAPINQVKIARTWASATGDGGWAGRLVQLTQDSKHQIPIVYAPGANVLQLVEEAACLMPPEQQWDKTFNTFFTRSAEECVWRCFHADVPESKGLAGTEFDLERIRTEGLKAGQENPYVLAARNGTPTVNRTPNVSQKSNTEKHATNAGRTESARNSLLKKKEEKAEIRAKEKADEDFLSKTGLSQAKIATPIVPPPAVVSPPKVAAGSPPPVLATRTNDELRDVIAEASAIHSQRKQKGRKENPTYIVKWALAACVVIIGGMLLTQTLKMRSASKMQNADLNDKEQNEEGQLSLIESKEKPADNPIAQKPASIKAETKGEAKPGDTAKVDSKAGGSTKPESKSGDTAKVETKADNAAKPEPKSGDAAKVETKVANAAKSESKPVDAAKIDSKMDKIDKTETQTTNAPKVDGKQPEEKSKKSDKEQGETRLVVAERDWTTPKYDKELLVLNLKSILEKKADANKTNYEKIRKSGVELRIPAEFQAKDLEIHYPLYIDAKSRLKIKENKGSFVVVDLPAKPENSEIPNLDSLCLAYIQSKVNASKRIQLFEPVEIIKKPDFIKNKKGEVEELGYVIASNQTADAYFERIRRRKVNEGPNASVEYLSHDKQFVITNGISKKIMTEKWQAQNKSKEGGKPFLMIASPKYRDAEAQKKIVSNNIIVLSFDKYTVHMPFNFIETDKTRERIANLEKQIYSSKSLSFKLNADLNSLKRSLNGFEKKKYIFESLVETGSASDVHKYLDILSKEFGPNGDIKPYENEDFMRELLDYRQVDLGPTNKTAQKDDIAKEAKKQLDAIRSQIISAQKHIFENAPGFYVYFNIPKEAEKTTAKLLMYFYSPNDGSL